MLSLELEYWSQLFRIKMKQILLKYLKGRMSMFPQKLIGRMNYLIYQTLRIKMIKFQKNLI
ncbi:unnamed protein product [Meloidogyne enterolobii]|uniref:Uncharacterized protein n=1 Tax=Meloidogyne enterolobii TaxID=390850 RepID=A0ACB0ZIT1_MELEN